MIIMYLRLLRLKGASGMELHFIKPLIHTTRECKYQSPVASEHIENGQEPFWGLR